MKTYDEIELLWLTEKPDKLLDPITLLSSPPVIVLTGRRGTGKTQVQLALGAKMRGAAERLGFPDFMRVYSDMCTPVADRGGIEVMAELLGPVPPEWLGESNAGIFMLDDFLCTWPSLAEQFPDEAQMFADEDSLTMMFDRLSSNSVAVVATTQFLFDYPYSTPLRESEYPVARVLADRCDYFVSCPVENTQSLGRDGQADTHWWDIRAVRERGEYPWGTPFSSAPDFSIRFRGLECLWRKENGSG